MTIQEVPSTEQEEKLRHDYLPEDLRLDRSRMIMAVNLLNYKHLDERYFEEMPLMLPTKFIYGYLKLPMIAYCGYLIPEGVDKDGYLAYIKGKNKDVGKSSKNKRSPKKSKSKLKLIVKTPREKTKGKKRRRRKRSPGASKSRSKSLSKDKSNSRSERSWSFDKKKSEENSPNQPQDNATQYRAPLVAGAGRSRDSKIYRSSVFFRKKPETGLLNKQASMKKSKSKDSLDELLNYKPQKPKLPNSEDSSSSWESPSKESKPAYVLVKSFNQNMVMTVISLNTKGKIKKGKTYNVQNDFVEILPDKDIVEGFSTNRDRVEESRKVKLIELVSPTYLPKKRKGRIVKKVKQEPEIPEPLEGFDLSETSEYYFEEDERNFEFEKRINEEYEPGLKFLSEPEEEGFVGMMNRLRKMTKAQKAALSEEIWGQNKNCDTGDVGDSGLNVSYMDVRGPPHFLSRKPDGEVAINLNKVYGFDSSGPDDKGNGLRSMTGRLGKAEHFSGMSGEKDDDQDRSQTTREQAPPVKKKVIKLTPILHS